MRRMASSASFSVSNTPMPTPALVRRHLPVGICWAENMIGMSCRYAACARASVGLVELVGLGRDSGGDRINPCLVFRARTNLGSQFRNPLIGAVYRRLQFFDAGIDVVKVDLHL